MLNTTVSDLASAERFREYYTLYDVLPLLESSNEDRRNLGIIKISQFKTSELINNNFRLGYEYKILSFLGIGGSYQYSRVVVTDVLSGDYALLPQFGISPPPPSNTPPDLSNYSTLFPRDLKSKITSLELEGTLHPIRNPDIWDPYFRFGYGTAIEGVFGPSEKFSYTLGSRFYFDPVYFLLEYSKSDLYGNLGRTNFAIDRGFRIGLGKNLF